MDIDGNDDDFDLDLEDELPSWTLVDKYMDGSEEDAIHFVLSNDCTFDMVNYGHGDANSSPIMLAAGKLQYNLIKALFDKGANPNYVDWRNDCNALMYCLLDKDYLDDEEIESQIKTVDNLIAGGVNVNYGHSHSAFTLACNLDLTHVIKILLQHSVDVQFKDIHGNTGLAYLSMNKNKEAIKLVNSYIMKKALENNLCVQGEPIKKPKI